MPKSIDNAISFDTSLRPGSLSSKRLCKSFIKLIEEAEKNHQLRNRRRREKDQIAFEDIVSCIFANLCLSAIGNSNRPIRISRSHGRISPKSRYNSSVLGKTFPKIIDELANPRVGILTQKIADPSETFATRQSTIKETQKFRKLVREAGLKAGDFRPEASSELILLKAKKTRPDSTAGLVEYKNTEKTNRMRSEMFEINDWLMGLEIELTGSLEGSHNVNNRQLKRHFTRADHTFGSGGRLFGGFWMGLSKKERERGLTLSGQPVCTLDISNLNPSLLYAIAEVERPDDDAYALPGLEQSRDGVKNIFNAMTFRDTPLKRFPSGTRTKFPRHVSIQDVLREIEHKHQKIFHLLNSQIGHQLQNKESNLMVDVLLNAKAEEIPALPVHDAIIIPDDKTEHGIRIIKKCFFAHTGYEAEIKKE